MSLSLNHQLKHQNWSQWSWLWWNCGFIVYSQTNIMKMQFQNRKHIKMFSFCKILPKSCKIKMFFLQLCQQQSLFCDMVGCNWYLFDIGNDDGSSLPQASDCQVDTLPTPWLWSCSLVLLLSWLLVLWQELVLSV